MRSHGAVRPPEIARYKVALGLLKQMLRTERGRVAGWATVVAGLIVLIVGWVGVSGSPEPASQLPSLIAAGAGSLALLGLGVTAVLAADLHDEWTKLDQIEGELRASGNGRGPGAAGSRNSSTASARRGVAAR